MHGHSNPFGSHGHEHGRALRRLSNTLRRSSTGFDDESTNEAEDNAILLHNLDVTDGQYANEDLTNPPPAYSESLVDMDTEPHAGGGSGGGGGPHRSASAPTIARGHHRADSADITQQTPFPRVRFSSDLERTDEEDGPVRRSLQESRATGAPVPAPRLSLDIASSPSRAVSFRRARNRGYSLRRSLFARNMLRETEEQNGDEHPTQPSEAEGYDDDLSDLEAGRHASTAASLRLQPIRSNQTEHYSSVPLDAYTPSPRPSSVDKRANVDVSINTDDGSSPRTSILKGEQRSTPGTSAASVSKAQQKWLRKYAARAEFERKFKTFKDGFRRHVLRIKPIPPTKDGRHIDLDVQRCYKGAPPLLDERTGKPYCSNFIRSSRYSLWSFFPKQLFAQFSKLANAYFLCVAILQMIPGLSTTGQYTTILPLLIFVSISMGKEGIDDLRRYRLDKEENGRIAFVLRPPAGGAIDEQQPEMAFRDEIDYDTLDTAQGESLPTVDESKYWHPTKWIDIKVGDVIKIERDQVVPADVVLLHADEPNGIAYIETMALDGETNLKSKQPCLPVKHACRSVESIIHASSDSLHKIHFAVEDPNTDLYKFDGNVTVAGEKLPLTNAEVILRGSILRNTKRAFGMVIYTGEECKIRMNANKHPRIKAPALQAYVNRVVAVIVLFVVVLAVACTIAYSFWSRSTEEKSWYLEEADVDYGPVFTSFLIMFNTLIPISLYVSLEIVKVGQMYFMHRDVDMYDEDTNTGLVARTSTINEELGQVSYIFSDKTGTLTNNCMRFRKISVAGTAWLHDHDILEEAAQEAEAAAETARRRMSKGKRVAPPRASGASLAGIGRRSSMAADPKTLARVKSLNEHSRRPKSGRTDEMLEYIRARPHTAFARKARFFLLGMALCHTCLPERGDDGEIKYQAASPDEAALVVAAKELGYMVVDRQPNTLTVRRVAEQQSGAGEEEAFVDEVYEVLNVIEFSSARKRMSIVLRMPDQQVCVFTKGADTTIMKLLRRSNLASDKMVAVDKRASVRKSLEAREAIRRNSMQVGAGGSVRRSLSVPRRSFASGAGDGPSMRRSMDVWLRNREVDPAEEFRSSREVDEHYNSRPSMQVRRSMAVSDAGRLSMQMSDVEGEDELVEESLVVNESQVFERCFQHLNDFATEGLRTLLYGYRFLDEEEYQEWKTAYHEASTSLVDRQEKIEAVGERIEQQLELLGATAIEDKLQKGVPEAIEKLRRANIKLWMLTGDKRETAINIGHSCHLVKDYSTVTILDYSQGNLEHTITAAINGINSGEVAHSVAVIDGQTLSALEDDLLLSERFFDLAILVDSVICCRASPKQKAYLVKSIRKRVHKSITLAVGDGANDIAMIQEAHVGIGIAGKEGLQAARISDYSIAQFRFLLKLLLVHGRWNYVRVCKYTLGTFWKETLFYLTQALYQRWNGYTGTSLYEPWGLSMFNTLFSSLCVIFLGILERDLGASTLLAVPELYNRGQRHKGFNVRLYLFWAFMAVCEAVIIFFTMYGLFGEAPINADNSIFPMGMLTFTACVVVINVKLQGLEIHYRTYFALAVNAVTIGGWFLWNVFLSRKYKDDKIYKVKGNFLEITGRNLLWWTVLLLAIMACILWEVSVNSVRRFFFPSDVDVFQEYEQDVVVRRRFEEASSLELAESWKPDDSAGNGKSGMLRFRSKSRKKSRRQVAEEKAQEERDRHVEEVLERRYKDDSSAMDMVLAVAEVENASAASAASASREQLTGGSGVGSFAGQGTSGSAVGNANAAAAAAPSRQTSRSSRYVQDLLRQGFGSIRRGTMH